MYKRCSIFSRGNWGYLKLGGVPVSPVSHGAEGESSDRRCAAVLGRGWGEPVRGVGRG